jgi:hypothetical protein
MTFMNFPFFYYKYFNVAQHKRVECGKMVLCLLVVVIFAMKTLVSPLTQNRNPTPS